MEKFFAALALALVSCSPVPQAKTSQEPKCISAEQVAAKAEQELHEAKARLESNQPAQPPSSDGKSPSQLAQEAALEGLTRLCNSPPVDPSDPEIPQVN